MALTTTPTVICPECGSTDSGTRPGAPGTLLTVIYCNGCARVHAMTPQVVGRPA